VIRKTRKQENKNKDKKQRTLAQHVSGSSSKRRGRWSPSWWMAHAACGHPHESPPPHAGLAATNPSGVAAPLGRIGRIGDADADVDAGCVTAAAGWLQFPPFSDENVQLSFRVCFARSLVDGHVHGGVSLVSGRMRGLRLSRVTGDVGTQKSGGRPPAEPEHREKESFRLGGRWQREPEATAPLSPSRHLPPAFFSASPAPNRPPSRVNRLRGSNEQVSMRRASSLVACRKRRRKWCEQPSSSFLPTAACLFVWRSGATTLTTTKQHEHTHVTRRSISRGCTSRGDVHDTRRRGGRLLVVERALSARAEWEMRQIATF
jgi:hypothetical protein